MWCLNRNKATTTYLRKQASVGKRRKSVTPKKIQSWYKKKLEITDWLVAHQSEIVSGEIAVFFLDECHLLWGDVCGYVWGQTSLRIEVPIVNERQRQTYFGALNYYTQEFLVKAYKKGDSESTIAFLQYLLSECPTSRITLIWDGASYHRSAEVRAYLDSLNHGLDQPEWKITCIRFAPNAPEQNPVEDVWLSARAFSSRVLPPVQIILCGEAIIRVCHSRPAKLEKMGARGPLWGWGLAF